MLVWIGAWTQALNSFRLIIYTINTITKLLKSISNTTIEHVTTKGTELIAFDGCQDQH